MWLIKYLMTYLSVSKKTIETHKFNDSLLLDKKQYKIATFPNGKAIASDYARVLEDVNRYDYQYRFTVQVKVRGAWINVGFTVDRNVSGLPYYVPLKEGVGCFMVQYYSAIKAYQKILHCGYSFGYDKYGLIKWNI